MADDTPINKKTIADTYPLPVYNYKVAIAKDDNQEIMSFSEVSGLVVEYEPVTYKHGLSFLTGTKIIPGMRQPIRITLKRGIIKNRGYLQEWLKAANNEPFSMSKKREITIDLCDEEGNAVVRWTVQKALPIKLEAPTFDAESNDIAVESMELIAHGIKLSFSP